MNVWYVSYGSNIKYERFMCYIKGEKPEGSNKKEKGCNDQSPPRRVESIEIPYQLYFAKERSKWGKGGVAFIDHEPNGLYNTYGRMYLITDSQFCDVVAQENNMEQITIDLLEVIANKFTRINDGWYGRIMFLGFKDGSPMFTFTSNEAFKDQSFNLPPSTYLITISKGLFEIGLSIEEVVSYFLKQPGISDHFTKTHLFHYLSLPST
ncbi:hypothetical protein [Heyndrickxia sporothermodurans]|uniref:hypothetical protein n=1 Tax=Heyndrickxia sporothermodurans TaxID=46224 RepID=UPI0035D8510D